MKRHSTSERGSILITVLIISSLMALMMTSYLKLSTNTLKLSNRAYYNEAAYNLAESGLEHGMSALNEANDGIPLIDVWSLWTLDGDNMKIKLTGFDFGGNTSGFVNIVILNFESDTPEIVVKSNIAGNTNTVATRFVYADLNKTSSGVGLFAVGVMGKEGITANGGGTFDSWDSNPDRDDSTPAVSYSAAVRDDNVYVATTDTGLGAINIGTADIYGFAAVGSDSEYGLSMNWGGHLGPRDDAEWAEEDTTDLHLVSGRKISHSTGALSTGFTATFEEVETPTDATLTSSMSLKSNNTATLGSAGSESIIEMSSLSIVGNAQLNVAGDVTLILSSNGNSALKVAGSGRIVLNSEATLNIYTPGSINIAGAGFANTGAPKNLQLWGTSTTSQDFKYTGSGDMSGLVYAPYADVKIAGGASVYGAIIGNTINVVGGGSIHYDESLADEVALGAASSAGGELSIGSVSELRSSTELQTYYSVLNF